MSANSENLDTLLPHLFEAERKVRKLQDEIAASDQGKAIEHLEAALKLLQPPQKQDQKQDQQQDQQKQDQQKQDQQKQDHLVAEQREELL